MAVPRRRSARLSKNAQQQTPNSKTTVSALKLGSLLERDETPDHGQQQSIDDVVETPASTATINQHVSRVASIRTPKTEPRPERGEMHPKTVHQTTTKAPDSGLKLGFVDISAQPRSLASLHNTPTKTRDNTPNQRTASTFEFKFNSDIQLSREAQKLMENVREEAARIKAQMQAEKSAQDKKDSEAEQMFTGVDATGRKIAKARGKSGRFSDVHMAQFKKMDSIANHASAFRTRPGFAQPTAQSLKRSGSKAGLDEIERPRTAGKGTPGRAPPPFLGRPSSISPFKSIPTGNDRLENTAPTKRPRRSEVEDVSASRQVESSQPSRLSAIPKSISSSLLSPTKASIAKMLHSPSSSPNKPSMLPKSNSRKSLLPTSRLQGPRPNTMHNSNVVVQPLQNDKPLMHKPLPPIPTEEVEDCSPDSKSILKSPSTTLTAPSSKPHISGSKLPMFSGLKSILRSARKSSSNREEKGQANTPKRLDNTYSGVDSGKKVDFTPSVKSRYAVKLAASSPSPAKLPHLTPAKLPQGPVVPYDPSAYVVEDDSNDDWEDADSEIDYPVLPPADENPAPVVHTFAEKAKDVNRRESKEFKSIFTTLHHPSRPSPQSTLTTVNTNVNKTGPTHHVNQILKAPTTLTLSSLSPSTIRHVRASGVSDLVQPFEDANVKTVPHGLPGKKRSRDSTINDDRYGTDEDAKENRRISVMPHVPGGWQDSILDEDEGEKRGGKRTRVEKSEELDLRKPEIKKPNTAREAAAKNAKERKGILSLSRLNMLSRPKSRG